MSSMSLNTEVGSFVIFTGVGGWSSTVMTKLVQLLETNGINPEDALFYLSTYLQDQEVTEDD